MEHRSITVSCPCCESVLEIDVRTATVLRHGPKGRVDEMGKVILDPERWTEATTRVEGRLGTAGDAFDTALGREQSRSKDLDDLFDKARKKVDRRGKGTSDPDHPLRD